MKLGILTDSTCDLPSHLLAEYDIEVVPAILIMGIGVGIQGLAIAGSVSIVERWLGGGMTNGAVDDV
jgi:hypothetical protein